MLNNLYCIYGTDFARQLGGPPQRQKSGVDQIGNTLVLQLSGLLSRSGENGTSTDQLRQQLATAAADPSVGRIVLVVNSPGGTSSGTAALHDVVAATARQKPVIAFCEDLAASAAFYAIAGCTRIIASRSALCGAIGTYAVLQDASGLADAMGVKVIVVRAGEHKGAATFGTSITEPQLREFQRIVNDVNAQFVQAVSAGRKLTGAKLSAVTDGRIHIASDAAKLGLVDEIGTLESVLATPVSASSSRATSTRHSNPALDFQQRLSVQQGTKFVPTYSTGRINIR